MIKMCIFSSIYVDTISIIVCEHNETTNMCIAVVDVVLRTSFGNTCVVSFLVCVVNIIENHCLLRFFIVL